MMTKQEEALTLLAEMSWAIEDALERTGAENWPTDESRTWLTEQHARLWDALALLVGEKRVGDLRLDAYYRRNGESGGQTDGAR